MRHHTLISLAPLAFAALLFLGCPGDDDDAADDDDTGDDDTGDDDTGDDDTGDDDTGDDDTEGPLGIPLPIDGVTYAGAAVIDITPTITETFTDLDGDAEFDGCFDDPDAVGVDCLEPFDDVDGDDWFDAVFIAGYGSRRAAQGVHDPITCRALVLSHDGEYIAFVSLDLVGLLGKRIHAARDALAADGLDGGRLLVATTHNHQGPDTLGMWGDTEDLANPLTGLNPDYQEAVTAAIEQAVRDAAAAMEPLESFKVGAIHMRDVDDNFNGAVFGGGNPTDIMHGMIKDIRDPVVVSDQLLVMQGLRKGGGAVFTYTNWSGHPEVWGDHNSELSADFVGVLRTVLEAEYGGTAIHMPESLGGMQSAGGGDLPLVDDNGVHVFQTCDAQEVADPKDAGCYGKQVGDPRTDQDGNPVPVWAEDETWDFTRSHGWHLAEAAMLALDTGEVVLPTPIQVDHEPMYVPFTNTGFQILAGFGLFDLDPSEAVTDPALCPEVTQYPQGCIEMNTFRAEMGPIGFIGAPGELLPELTWGMPDSDPAWLAEVDDPSARGPLSTYFRQHDNDCDALAWADCLTPMMNVGDCNCLKVHAWPYEISADPTMPPMLDLLDTEYRAALSMLDDHFGYVIPEPDFNPWVSILTDDGDHYEDTVSLSFSFATKTQEAQRAIDDRW